VTSEPVYRNHWLCLDCSEDLSLPGGDYYGLKNQLWRQLVPRSQRHGMLCLRCVQTRLGRVLIPDDYKQPSDTFDLDDPIHGPMTLDDYGILDDLRVPRITEVDQYLIDLVGSEAKRIRTVILAVFKNSSGSLPQVTDLFYEERLEFLIDTGALQIVQDSEEFMNIRILSSKAKCRE
jgi:hypothetical protein